MKLIRRTIMGAALLNVMAGAFIEEWVPAGSGLSHALLGVFVGVLTLEVIERIRGTSVRSGLSIGFLTVSFLVGFGYSYAKRLGDAVVDFFSTVLPTPVWVLLTLAFISTALGAGGPIAYTRLKGRAQCGVYLGVKWQWNTKKGKTIKLKPICPRCNHTLTPTASQRHHTAEGLPVTPRFHDEAHFFLECHLDRISFVIRGFVCLEDAEEEVLALITDSSDVTASKAGSP